MVSDSKPSDGRSAPLSWHLTPLHLAARCLIVLASTASGAALAEEVSPRPAAALVADRVFTLDLPLTFQGAYLGDVTVEATGDGHVRVKVDRFIALLGERLSPALVDEIEAAAGPSEFLALEALDGRAVTVTYDAAALELKVAIPLDRQGGQTVSAHVPYAFGEPGPATIAPTWFSASLTLTARQTYEHGGDRHHRGFSPFRAAADLAANIFGDNGVYVFAEGLYDDGARHAFQRGNAVAFYDDRETAIRYAVGDVAPVAAGFQSAPVLGGLSIQRDYAQIQPFTNIRPSGLFRFTLDRSATIDVVVNGSTIRTLKLDPGQYDLKDFPFFNGLNEVQLYVVDGFGRRLLATFNQFFSTRLLDQGIFEFGVSAGYPQHTGDAAISYDEDNFAASGYVRYGLTPEITIGANLQSDHHTIMAGTEIGWASPIGTIGALVSWNQNVDGSAGYSYLVSYEFLAESLGILQRPQINIEYLRTSAEFAGIGDIAFDAADYEIRGRIAAQLPLEIGVGFSASYSDGRGPEPDEIRSAASVSRAIGFANLTATYERLSVDGEPDDDRVLLSATIALGPNENGRGSYDSAADRVRAEYTRFQRDEVGSYGLRASAQRDRDSLAGAGAFAYNANRFAAILQHDVITEANGGAIVAQQSSYEIATQVAVAGSRAGIGRPVGPRFALVAAHDTLDGHVVDIREGEGREEPQAQADMFGAALVPAGSSYTPHHLLVDVADAPAGYDIGPGQYDVFPGPAAGYAVTVGSDASRVVMGTLIATDARPIALLGGELRSLEDPEAKPVLVFTNSTGRFVAQGVAPGRYVLDLGNGAVRAEIDVADETTGLIDVGIVEVVLKPAGSR